MRDRDRIKGEIDRLLDDPCTIPDLGRLQRFERGELGVPGEEARR